MNVPNKVTLIRIAIIPTIIVLHYLDPERLTRNAWSIAIGVLFVLAALTDLLDGYLARRTNTVSDFGKFIDPLADKLLVTAGLLVLLDMTLVPMWIVVIILTREFMVTGLRLVAVNKGYIIASGDIGRVKTFMTMTAISLLLFHLDIAGLVLMYIALALTIVSGIEYFMRNRGVFKSM